MYQGRRSLPDMMDDEIKPKRNVEDAWLFPRISLDIIHELGRDLSDTYSEKSLTLPASMLPTVVTFKSTVRAANTRALRSPAYLASIRRRETAAISRMIDALPTIADSDQDFLTCVHEPYDHIQKLIDTLSSAEDHRDTEIEGNSCEILRQIRDTFTGSSWKAYRSRDVCAATLSVLKWLSTEDEITSEFVYRSLEELIAAGLSPATEIPVDDVEEEEISD